VPGCVCERFEPVPEIVAGAAVVRLARRRDPGRGGAPTSSVAGTGHSEVPGPGALRQPMRQRTFVVLRLSLTPGDMIAVARADVPAYPAAAPAASEPEPSRRPQAPPAVQPPSPDPGHPPRGADREAGRAWDHRHSPDPRWCPWPPPGGPYDHDAYAHPFHRLPVPTWEPGHWRIQ
jgi:hypothetical protein